MAPREVHSSLSTLLYSESDTDMPCSMGQSRARQAVASCSSHGGGAAKGGLPYTSPMTSPPPPPPPPIVHLGFGCVHDVAAPQLLLLLEKLNHHVPTAGQQEQEPGVGGGRGSERREGGSKRGRQAATAHAATARRPQAPSGTPARPQAHRSGSRVATPSCVAKYDLRRWVTSPLAVTAWCSAASDAAAPTALSPASACLATMPRMASRVTTCSGEGGQGGEGQAWAPVWARRGRRRTPAQPLPGASAAALSPAPT